MPSIVACGARDKAYDRFETEHKQGDREAFLLVDAEGPVLAGGSWEHLLTRDGWKRPDGATEDQCHLMESWFLADRETLREFYGQGFREKALPSSASIERVPKKDVEEGLKNATRDTRKGAYSKGKHSFAILGEAVSRAHSRSLSPCEASAPEPFNEVVTKDPEPPRLPPNPCKARVWPSWSDDSSPSPQTGISPVRRVPTRPGCPLPARLRDPPRFGRASLRCGEGAWRPG